MKKYSGIILSLFAAVAATIIFAGNVFAADLFFDGEGLSDFTAPYAASGTDLGSAFMAPHDYNTPNTVVWELPTIDGNTVNNNTFLGKIQVFIFYKLDGTCYNSNNTISSIANSEWVKSDKVKVIAIGLNYSDDFEEARQATVDYKNKYAPDCDDIVFAYGTTYDQTYWTWIDFESLTGKVVGHLFAMNYVIDKDNYFRFTWDGNYHSSYYESVLSLLDNDFKSYGVYKTAVEGYEEYSEAETVLRLLNEYRVSQGLNELKTNPELSRAAMQRAAENSLYYSHIRPNGSQCGSVLSGSDITYIGENIAFGYGTPNTVMTAWKRSSGHNRNMLEPNYSSVGIGCFTDLNGVKYWVQLFSGTEVEQSDLNMPERLKTCADVDINSGIVSTDISPAELKISEGQSGSVTLSHAAKNSRFISPSSRRKIPKPPKSSSMKTVTRQ